MARIWREILARVTAIDPTFRLIKCPGDLEERPTMRLPSGETDYFKKAALTAISSQITKSRVSSGRRVDFRRTDCPRDSSARSKSQSTPFSEVPRAIDLPCKWSRKFSGGTSVTVTGSGFSGATAVNFGSLAATSFSVTSATPLTAVSPAVPARARLSNRIGGCGVSNALI